MFRSRGWFTALGLVLTVAFTAHVEAIDAVSQSTGSARAVLTPEPTLLVLLGLCLTFAAYQLRRHLGTPGQRSS
ncbi:MAG: hypothetical protein ABI634_09860 [Acidobacteriota bacterium]